MSAPKQQAEFLGLSLDTSFLPKWRHSQKKIAKWLKWWMPFRNPEVLRRDLTPRVVAKIVGISVFDGTIRFVPLFELSDVIEILRGLHEKYNLHRKRDWYQGIVLSNLELDILKDSMEKILLNPWHHSQSFCAPTREWIAVSDASDHGFGFVILQGSPERLFNTSLNHLGTTTPGSRFPGALGRGDLSVLTSALGEEYKILQAIPLWQFDLENLEPVAITKKIIEYGFREDYAPSKAKAINLYLRGAHIFFEGSLCWITDYQISLRPSQW